MLHSYTYNELYEIVYVSLYKKMYNDNKYFYYIRRRIMTINILLYKKMYNKIFVCVIQEDV